MPITSTTRLIFIYLVTLCVGFFVALLLARLVGLAMPSLRGWVFAVVMCLWAWSGWKYARVRDQMDARREK